MNVNNDGLPALRDNERQSRHSAHRGTRVRLADDGTTTMAEHSRDAARILAVAWLALFCLLGRGAADELPEAYRDGPYYDELLGDVARLKLIGRVDKETACSRDVTAPNPCAQVKTILKEIIEARGLPATPETAEMLQAYAEGDYRKADRLYAAARGYELPDYLKDKPATEVGAAIAALGVRQQVPDDTSCTNDPFGTKPCPQAVQAFKRFTRERGLPQNAQTADMFVAFVQGDSKTGERLYASLSGEGADPANELLADVRSYGVPPEEGSDTACKNNYFAAKPCPPAVTAWRDFSRKHGLELTQTTADLFEAFLVGDTVTGDKLYAAAKGISVATLLHERGHDVDLPSLDPLYVPIHPPVR